MRVDNPPSNEEIQTALNGELKELWALFSTLEGDSELDKAKSLVKHGIKHEFSIEKVVRGFVTEHPDTDNIKIRGYNKFNLYEYWDEMREREKIMKDILREQLTDALEMQGEEEWEE